VKPHDQEDQAKNGFPSPTDIAQERAGQGRDQSQGGEGRRQAEHEGP